MTGQEAVLDRGRVRSVLAAALLLVAPLLAGCGPAAGSPATPSSQAATEGVGTVTTAPDGVQEVTLQTQDDYVFTPDRFTVAPGKVRLTVVNAATQLTHNFRFTPGKGPAAIQPEIPLLPSGDRKTIEFTVQEPGDYQFECSFHTQLNQFGVMTVRG
jgi:plastocyanin